MLAPPANLRQGPFLTGLQQQLGDVEVPRHGGVVDGAQAPVVSLGQIRPVAQQFLDGTGVPICKKWAIRGL